MATTVALPSDASPAAACAASAEAVGGAVEASSALVGTGVACSPGGVRVLHSVSKAATAAATKMRMLRV
jgi:hypothetical protein